MRRLPLGFAMTLLAGCASAPEAHYWSLQRTAQPVAAASATCVVQLAPVVVPESYDRADIVTTDGPHRIAYSDSEQWEAPLPQVLSDRIADALRHELSGATVYAWPSILADTPDYTLHLQLRQIEATLGGKVTLAAQWLSKPAAGSGVAGNALVAHKTTDGGYASLVEATGAAIDDLAGAIAADMRKSGACGLKRQ